MSAIDELLANNRRLVRSSGEPAPAQAKGVVVLTCIDARLDPARFLGFEPGEVHVIRNAGGRATDDALRSIVVATTLLSVQEVAIIQHTQCAMLRTTNGTIRAAIADELGADASGVDFLPIEALERSLTNDVQRIRSSPFLRPSLSVRGFVYEIETGALREGHD